MKTFLSLLTTFILGAVANAGPSISAGPAPSPLISTMSLQEPVAGIDAPTETISSVKTVLVLHNKRIPIFDDLPQLVDAEAGVDYPTSVPAPFWTEFQAVLVFKVGMRVPVRLMMPESDLVWQLPTGETVKVQDIHSIRRAEAAMITTGDEARSGASSEGDHFVLILLSGCQVRMN